MIGLYRTASYTPVTTAINRLQNRQDPERWERRQVTIDQELWRDLSPGARASASELQA
jgi:hypothetical protein